ncbi:hypothetical protein RND71_019700 [Anisodus tanguticus]|uniref:Uncharacterized protein n=1 Tax=Anisodus tanguticus TaxID=243964 RepID=A0AAE1RZH0_9SOLA|nr:hypothetical protein RND71_019700 [Anisodus tanguticus]
MEDLEDINLLKSPHHVRSFFFHVFANPYDQLMPRLKSNCEVTEHKLVQHDKGSDFLLHKPERVEENGLGVEIDERDVSMHAGFKELKELLLGEEYIGGVDEICRMHEDGQLEKIVESCERVEDGFVRAVEILGLCHVRHARGVVKYTMKQSMMKKKNLKKMSVVSNDAQIAMRMGLHGAQFVVINIHQFYGAIYLQKQR